MLRTKWIERTFTFDFPEGWIYNIIERLRGTGPRLHDIISSLSDDQLGYTPGGKWSIKEHIGHLYDLEELHSGRVADFIELKKELRPADITNEKTKKALYNSRNAADLVTLFANAREELISQLESLDDDTLLFKSLHPRLKTSMRPIDLAYFTAEHDDHHLASIREITIVLNRK